MQQQQSCFKQNLEIKRKKSLQRGAVLPGVRVSLGPAFRIHFQLPLKYLVLAPHVHLYYSSLGVMEPLFTMFSTMLGDLEILAGSHIVK